MYRTDDPIADFARWDAEQESFREQLPLCVECGNHIEDDFCYEINSEYICQDCLDRNYKKVTTDLIGW